MSQENVEIVRELFERFNEVEFGQLRDALGTSSSLPEAAAKMGDLGRWHLDRVHPEIELDASALPPVPEGNRGQGHQGWFEFWRTWLLPWEEFKYTPKRWHESGDCVAVELVQRGRLAGGLEYATPISNVWTFGGEKVVRLQMFGTWAEALEAAAPMSQENVEIVREQIDAFNRGDFSAAIEALDEDVEWQVPHIAALDAPASGLLRGRREMIESFRQWFEAWDSFAFEVMEIRAGREGNVFMAGVQTGRGRTSGVDVTVPTFHVVTVRNGKIARMRTLRDRGEALEAAGLSEQDAHADS